MGVRLAPPFIGAPGRIWKKGTLVARRVRKARGLSQIAQLPGKFCEI